MSEAVRDEIARRIMANWANLPLADPSQIEDRQFMTTGAFPESYLPDHGMTPELRAAQSRWVDETNARMPVTRLSEQAGLRDIKGFVPPVISGPELSGLMKQQRRK